MEVVASRAANGTTIARASSEAIDLDAILGAVRRVAASVRSALGDSPQQVNLDARLEPVTTASLDALRHHTAGVALADEGRGPPPNCA